MEILENPYVEKVTVIESPKGPRKRPTKVSYKDKLAERHARYSDTINTVEGTLKIKLDEYYAALSGNYEYIDTHTGNTVHARTYKKRIGFAEQKLAELEKITELYLRYDKLEDDRAVLLMEHARNIYNIAIKDNRYLKDKNIVRSAAARRLKSQLSSLEDKVISGTTEEVLKMNAPTGYTHFAIKPVPNFPKHQLRFKFRQQVQEVIRKNRLAPSPTAIRTSRMNAVKMQRPKIPTSRPNINYSVDEAKLPQDTPTYFSWPISKEEERKLELKSSKKKFALASIFSAIAAQSKAAVTNVATQYAIKAAAYATNIIWQTGKIAAVSMILSGSSPNIHRQYIPSVEADIPNTLYSPIDVRKPEEKAQPTQVTESPRVLKEESGIEAKLAKARASYNKIIQDYESKNQEKKSIPATRIEQPKYSLIESSRILPSPGIIRSQRGYTEDIQNKINEQERIRKLNEESRQMAIRRAQAAQGKLHPIFSPQTQMKMLQQEEAEKERAEKESQRVPILISAREAAMKIWERRFKERAERDGRPVVKQVVYAVGQEPVITFPHPQYKEHLATYE